MTRWRPVAYVAVRDDHRRASIAAALREQGWAVLEARTGFHLVQALSGLILGDTPWLRVGLVVVDDALPGCRGSSIARGLRELGIDVPVRVIGPGSDPADIASLIAAPARSSSSPVAGRSPGPGAEVLGL
jgi:DNA-binding response OmpR family regulator